MFACKTTVLRAQVKVLRLHVRLVGWSLTSVFSTNTAISETKGPGWRVILLPSEGRLAIYRWRRINRTIQRLNRVYENLHKTTPLTLLEHRQTRRQKF